MDEKPGGAGGRGKNWFTTTQWSLVLAAGDRQRPDHREALAALCQMYWYPVYVYVRRRGTGADAAQDLTQGFFAHLLEKGALRAADRDRGRFRTFLLSSLKNYLTNEWERERALKRGGGEPPIPLDGDSADSRYRLEPFHEQTPDKAFEKRWALTLLDRVLVHLREEVARSQHPERFERLSIFLTGERAGPRYDRIAEELGMTESAVKVAVHRMRRRFGELLRTEVGRTVDDPQQVDEEIRYLFAAMET